MEDNTLVDIVKWCDSWEKNFESSMKAVKKFKDDIGTRPQLSPTTEKKYLMHIDLLILELTETKEHFTKR